MKYIFLIIVWLVICVIQLICLLPPIGFMLVFLADISLFTPFKYGMQITDKITSAY